MPSWLPIGWPECRCARANHVLWPRGAIRERRATSPDVKPLMLGPASGHPTFLYNAVPRRISLLFRFRLFVCRRRRPIRVVCTTKPDHVRSSAGLRTCRTCITRINYDGGTVDGAIGFFRLWGRSMISLGNRSTHFPFRSRAASAAAAAAIFLRDTRSPPTPRMYLADDACTSRAPCAKSTSSPGDVLFPDEIRWIFAGTSRLNIRKLFISKQKRRFQPRCRVRFQT